MRDRLTCKQKRVFMTWELRTRLDDVHLPESREFGLPMTQDLIA